MGMSVAETIKTHTIAVQCYQIYSHIMEAFASSVCCKILANKRTPENLGHTRTDVSNRVNAILHRI
jgi:hypothetical protein